MKTLTDEEYEKLVEKASYQDARKPELECDGYDLQKPVYDAYCPKCGCELDEYIDLKCCRRCGQKIDWSE